MTDKQMQEIADHMVAAIQLLAAEDSYKNFSLELDALGDRIVMQFNHENED